MARKRRCPTCKKPAARTWILFINHPEVCESCYLEVANMAGYSAPSERLSGVDKKMYRKLQENLPESRIVAPPKDSRSVGGVFVRTKQ